MTKTAKTTLTLTAVFLIVEAAILLALFHKGHPEYLWRAVPPLILTVYTIIEIKYGFYMNTYARLVTMMAIVSDNFFGFYMNFYLTSFVFDKIQHVVGSYAFALFTYILVAQLAQSPMRKLFKFILVISIGLSVGVIYEIMEFCSDLISKTGTPSQVSLLDTNLDLVGNAVGSLLAAIHAAFYNLPDKH